MNKTVMIFLLLLTNASVCFPLSVQEFLKLGEKTILYSDINEFRTIQFYEDKTVEFIDAEYPNEDALWNKKYRYELIEKDKFLFLELQITNKKNYLILLSGENLIVYSTNDSKPIFNGVSKGSTELYFFPIEVVASSELVEGNKIYNANNISNLNLDEPWIEGVKGYGIGETITFSCNAEEMIVCTGYISIKKSYLWLQNSRTKSLKITFKKSGTSISYNLMDSPNPQRITFGFIYSGEIQITILDVYPGTKYDDTCIHSIMLKY